MKETGEDCGNDRPPRKPGRCVSLYDKRESSQKYNTED